MPLTVNEIVTQFGYGVLAGKNSLNRKIDNIGFDRAGIELSGNIIPETVSRIILLGKKESKYVKSLAHAVKLQRYEDLAKTKPPVILLSKNFEDKDLVVVCEKYELPLLKSADMGSTDIVNTLGNYISDRLMVFKTIHGTLLEIYGEGTLIQGKSGVGKSELAMEMIRKGHLFIADDAVAISRIGDHLVAKADQTVKNFIEVRGLGILNVSRMYGIEKIKSSTSIQVIIELVKVDEGHVEFERLGEKQNFTTIDGVKVPHYRFPLTYGRQISDLVESAIIDLKLRREGYNSAKEFMQNYDKIKGK